MISLPKFTIYVLVILKTVAECCDCESRKNEKQINDVEDKKIYDEAILIRQPIQNEQYKKNGDGEYEAESLVEIEQPANRTNDSRSGLAKSTDSRNPGEEVREETPKIDFESTCPYFKNVGTFNQSKMVDVWQIAFYRTDERLFCFKIHIKKINDKSRQSLLEDYGDFRGLVNWTNCQFEVVSSASPIKQRHFLQTTAMGRGVYHNIIVRYKKKVGTILLDQSPDQWLVVKNMLLMRDCENGHVVIFSRVPMEPSLRDIREALASFKEPSFNGSMACEGLNNPKYQILS